VCLEMPTRHALHIRIVRLTERPMGIDGLVVDQDPRPLSKAHRGGTLTVQLSHPPAGRAGTFGAVPIRGGEPIAGVRAGTLGIVSGAGCSGVAVGCWEPGSERARSACPVCVTDELR
jgi:hypothetical protein